MKKNILCLVAALGAINSAQALDIRPVVGANGSLLYMNSIGHVDSGVAGGASLRETIQYSNSSFHGGLVLGVAAVFDDFFLELDYEPYFGSAKSKVDLDNSSNQGLVIQDLVINMTQEKNHVFSFKVGHALTKSFDVFAKVDLLYSTFKMSYDNPTTGGHGRAIRKRTGIAPGIGVQKTFQDGSIILRGDYSYQIFSKIKSGDISTEHGPLTRSVELSATPRAHKFTLGLIYRFNFSK